jgi:hypothetical protein
MIVIIKRSSEVGELLSLRFGDETLRNDDKLVFGLLDVAREEFDDAVDGVVDRSCFGNVDLLLAESGERRCKADCALYRGLKYPFVCSSLLSNIFVFDGLKNI